jgi:hypothetical protein
MTDATCPFANDCPVNAKLAGCPFSDKLAGGEPFWWRCWHLPQGDQVDPVGEWCPTQHVVVLRERDDG